MIRSLRISNYALINNLEIEFGEGFNIITGETGAGKSIILGALGLLLGGRADMRAVRAEDRKSIIEAVFDISPDSPVLNMLDNNGYDSGDNCIVLRRELLPGGRSRAFINHSPANLQNLRDIAIHLVDIHSQHQNLLLADQSYQLEIIDNLADNASALEEYHRLYALYRKALKEYTSTRDLINRNRADADFLAYQYNELKEMELQPGEQASLEHERDILANLGDVQERLCAATEPLDYATGPLRQAVNALESLASALGNPEGEDTPDFHALAERLESARVEASDIYDTLMDYDTSLSADPGRLDEVEERLSSIYSLEVKHHVDNSDALISLRDRLQSQLEALGDGDNVLSRLELAAKRAKKAAVAAGNVLSERRADAAAEFASELRRRAVPLGMPNLRCEITLTRGKLGPDGYDQIQFLFAFNKNQALLPVGATASGGEISRLMLSIKSIVAERMSLPSIIFDEVDTGVSGDIAARMADMMSLISRNIQVVTITHLPAVAAMGTTHFKVYKEDDDTTTSTHIRKLEGEERSHELALMLSGNAADKAAIAAAKALLSKNK